MIVDNEGNKMTPSTVAKALFYHWGSNVTVLHDTVELTGAQPDELTDREVGLIMDQYFIVCKRMAKQLLGKK